MERIHEIGVELEDARAALKNVKDDLAGRPARPLELATMTALTEKIGNLERELAAEREQVERNRDSAAGVRRPDGDEQPTSRQRAGGAGIGARYADLFGAPKASGFKSGEDFFRALHRGATTGQFDPMLAPQASMGISVGSEGGFAVPEPVIAGWLDTGLESEIVRPRAQVFPMTTDMINLPGWSDTDHSAGLVAGFRSYWTAELASLAESSGKLRMVQITLVQDSAVN